MRDEIARSGRPPNDLVFKQSVGPGDGSEMRVIGNIGLSPLDRIVITIT